jgi:hypothetical protein
MSEPTRSTMQVTVAQARAFAILRNGLTRSFSDPVDVFRALAAVQAQYAASVPLSVHARCPSASYRWVDRAIAKEQLLVKTWCLRGTLHAVAVDDLALMAGACGERYHASVERLMLRSRGINARTWQRIEEDVLKALKCGPLDRTALHEAVPRLKDVPYIGWGEDVKGLAYRGDIVMIGSKGPRPVFARRDQWLPDLRWRPHTPAKSIEQLLLRYLATYGPATVTDFTHWSGLPAVAVRDTVKRIGELLEIVSVDGHRGDMLIRAEDRSALLGKLPPPPAVALLPKFDALLMAWKDPSRVLDGGARDMVFRPAGQIEATILLRGMVAATWRLKQAASSMHVTVTPFQSASSVTKRQVDAEFQRLGVWSGVLSTTVDWQD